MRIDLGDGRQARRIAEVTDQQVLGADRFQSIQRFPELCFHCATEWLRQRNGDPERNGIEPERLQAIADGRRVGAQKMQWPELEARISGIHRILQNFIRCWIAHAVRRSRFPS